MEDIGVLVEELAKLLAEEKRVEEKMRETQAALSGIEKKISDLVHRYVAVTDEKVPLPEDLLKEEQSHKHILRAFLDIKNDIAKQIRTRGEQIVQANANHLKQTFEHEKNKLRKCLVGIDQKILDCRQCIEQHNAIRWYLNTLNESLSGLGTDALPIPDPLPTPDLVDIITGRIEHLRSQGKF